MPLVLQAVRELAHQMDAQSTDGPFLKGLCCVGLGRFQWIERLTVIFDIDSHLSRLNAKPHRDLVFLAVGVTIGDDVGENFSHGEVEIVQDISGRPR